MKTFVVFERDNMTQKGVVYAKNMGEARDMARRKYGSNFGILREG